MTSSSLAYSEQSVGLSITFAGMIHLNITVSGRVQGIGFRFSAMEIAYKYGVKGFVMNRPDDSVYIEAEGEEGPMKDFVSWCRKGPYGARVTTVTTAPGPVQGFTAFDIRRFSS